MQTGHLCTAWTAAIAGFNDDDLTLLADLLAPGCVFEHVGTSSNEIIERLRAGRASGWLRHEILSINAVGSVLATTARNTHADGTDFYVAGAARFNEDGQIFYITAIDENPNP